MYFYVYITLSNISSLVGYVSSTRYLLNIESRISLNNYRSDSRWYLLFIIVVRTINNIIVRTTILILFLW